MGARQSDGSWQDSCLAKVNVGEPIFVLRAQDVTAPWTVRQWAHRAQELGCPQVKIDEAIATAAAMEAWATRHANGGKVPD